MAEFAYGALGRRIRKRDCIADTNNIYYYNDNWQVLCDYNDSGVLQHWFAYGNYIDETLITGKLYLWTYFRYYVHDHLYSPVALTNHTGTVQERYEYDAYGNCHILEPNFAPAPDGKSDFGNPYLFTGRRVDILDSGSLTIQYNRNRYYDQYTARWLTHDPLGYVDSMNLYEYASSNPVITIDPSGSSAAGIRAGIRVGKIIHRICTGWFEGPRLWRQVEGAVARLIAAGCHHGSKPGGGHPYEHCKWGCELAKKYDKEHAKKCGGLKEDVDWAIADWADSIRSACWDRIGDTARKLIANWVCSAYQLSDLRDNAAGRDCGTNECLKCKYETCKDCCAKEKKIPPGTPEGPEHGRDWGPRCTGRYLKEM